MAKILLNVELDSAKAQSGLKELQDSLKLIADSMKDVKPNKDLTKQIKALSEYYKNLTTAAEKANKAQVEQAALQAKLAKLDAEAETALAKKAKATSEVAIAAEKVAQAIKKTEEATAKAQKADTAAKEAAEKHAAAQEKRAAAAAKAAEKDEEEEKPLWNLEKAYASLYTRITSMAEKYPLLADVMGRYGTEVKETHDALVEYNRGRSDEIEDVDTLKERYDRLSASLSSVVADTKEANEAIRSEQEEMDRWAKSVQDAEDRVDSMRVQLYGMLTTISNIENRYPSGTFDQLKSDIQAQITGLQGLDRENEHYVEQVEEAGKRTGEFKEELARTRAETEHAAPAVATLGEKFGNLVERYAKFYASSLLVRKPLQLIQSALADVGDTLVSTENAVIELNRVLDDPQPTQEAANRLYDIAYAYGSTFENASQIAANFARSGKSWNESLEATEAALLAMNVAELNATEASDGLLSIIAQFDMKTSDLIDVVDKLNKTADKNPVSTQKLLQAIQRAGSAAKNANVSFDQTLGLITAISEATNRSGQNIGTAVNSLIQYSQKNVDVFAELSKESADMVEKYKLGLASIVDVWNQVSIDIKNDKTARDNIIEALGTDDLEELSSTLHDELGDLISEIDNTYNVANTYRKNYFIALLDNMDRYLKVQEQLTDYQGYSRAENEKYMETYIAKVNQLNDAWQKLANDEQGILGFKKNLVEAGIVLVELVDNGGGVLKVGLELAGVVSGIVTLIKSAKIAEGIGSLKKTLEATKTAAVVLGQALGIVKTEMDEAAASAMALQGTVGWIGIAVTAISVLIGVYNAYNDAQEEARQRNIELAKSHHDDAIELDKLYEEYIKLSPESEEYREIEDKIVTILGEKAKLLPELEKGTDKYREAVINLTEAQLAQYKMEQLSAKKSAGEELLKDASGINKGAKYDFYFSASRFSGNKDNHNTIESIIKYYDWLEEKRAELSEQYFELIAQGEDVAAQQTYSIWEMYGEQIDAVSEKVEAYKSTIEGIDEVEKALAEDSSAGIHIWEIEEAVEEAGDAAEEAGAKYDKAALGADNFAEALAADTAKLKSEADAIKTVRAAQEEFAENGKLSIETISKLASLGSDWVDVLFDENGAVNVNSSAVYELLGAKNALLDGYGVSISATEDEAAAIETVTEKMKDYSAQIDDVQSAISVLNDVQAEYDATGSLSIDTLQKLLELGGEYLDLIIDEQGAIALDKEKLDELISSKKVLLESLIQEQTAQYAVTLIHEKMAETEHEVGTQAEQAAERVGIMAAQVLELQGDSEGAALALEGLKTALAQIGAMDGVSLTEDDLAEISGKTVAYYTNLHNLLENAVNTGTSGWTPSSSSSSGTQKDEYLEELKAAVSLRESELTLMQHQGASQDEQIQKIKQIQEAIHTEADYLRSIGASQEDINKLSSEWWTWQEKIESIYEKTAQEAEKAAEEAEKARIAAINAETDRRKQVVADLKAELTLWEKQGKSVTDQVEQMKRIQSALHDEAEQLRMIQATEDGIKVTQADIDALSAEWWDWQEKILKLYQETLEAARDIELEAQQKIIDGILNEIKLEEEALELSEKRLAIDEARADLEDAIAKAKLDYVQTILSDYITALSDAETLESKQRAVAEAREKLVTAEREAQAKAIVDAFKAEKDVKSDALSLEEKRLAVEKARQALIDAENDRTTRVYNEATGQWEHQANAKAVQSAKDNLEKAVEALNSYVEEQAWNEVTEAVEAGSVSEAEVLEILSKWAKEAYGNRSPEFVQKIQTAFRKAMGTAASPDSVAGQISAVDSAVEALNDYLKSEAVKELKEYIAAGNTDAAGMKSILDKWLSLGEGAELYEWRDGLLESVNGAIISGYYDDTKVQSQIEAVERAVDSLHDYLRNKFISEISDLVKNGTAEQIRAAIEKWKEYKDFDLSDSDLDWATRAADAVEQKESTQSMWDAVMAGDKSSGTINWVLDRMKKNSALWWDADRAGDDAEKKRLADENYFLGTSMGWTRKDNGHWYDEYGYQVYDKGGVLAGKGGIKATNRPEIVLDPDLTSRILQPRSEAQFRAFADAMHLMFERGNRTRADLPIIRSGASSDSHDTSYTVNGIPISSGAAERYTIAELFRMLPVARS